MQPIIITGGPGAGKTSLLNMLTQRGYMAFPEVSRTLIRQQAAIDGVLPWTDLPRFAAMCLDMMAEQREQALRGTMPAFVDRAIGDICAYLTLGGEDVDPLYVEAAQGYYPLVFFCEPHEDIYVQDDERPHTFKEAQAIHQQLKHTYIELGYEVVEVPWGEIDVRASWVLTRLKQGGAV
ncbi:AAA family ATPase [Photobacterium minamisatsumaniensis]|uniref:AAA family ATPase n=1 Tax=Photobacterium minamisatsumaniensis TaxID=2910233 RepID=UPI003D10619B